MAFRDNTGDVTYKSGNTIDINSMQPTPIVYPTQHPENFAGNTPVMISKDTTLTAVIDATFATDSAVATLTSITSSVWTPTITGDAALFSNTINRKSGFYQKIGNVVQFTLHAEFQNPTASLIMLCKKDIGLFIPFSWGYIYCFLCIFVVNFRVLLENWHKIC